MKRIVLALLVVYGFASSIAWAQKPNSSASKSAAGQAAEN